MGIHINHIITTIDILGVVQGLLFGTMLLFLHLKRNKPSLYLGLFILLFAMEPIPNILSDSGILKSLPQLNMLPVHFHFLAFPLLYIYTQKVSIIHTGKPSYWTLIPGFLEVIAGLVLFFLPEAAKLGLMHTEYAIFYFVLGLIYTIYISMLIVLHIRAHQKEVENQFSEMYRKRLEWLQLFVFTSIGYHILLLINFFVSSPHFYFVLTCINAVLIYWISYKGIIQDHVESLYPLPEKTETGSRPHHHGNQNTEIKGSEPVHEVDKLPFMQREEMEEVIETIDEYINQSECYLQEDLTIVDIAEATNIHPKRISNSLNKQKGMNFNNYINKFRVEKAKVLFCSTIGNQLSVEGVGTESGFHSKATFYSAFKKFEGCTPANYKNR